ncbi:GNAT family N-acetyltransferase [Streptomyces sp. NPDC090022]|uniref:GNAT family N-acetyltransferase n=1 Tax=Streptomyces sp. NPDC090022 TaxID=3365920 RepID=UPI0037F9FF28
MTITQLSVPPTDPEVDAWLAVLDAVRSADRPLWPAPSRVEVAGRLRVPSVRGRSVQWAAGDEGIAALLLFSDEENRHSAFIDVLTVTPHARRRGVATALWEAVRAELLAHGRTTVSAMIDDDGPGEAFARAQGFAPVLPMGWYVQQVPQGPTGPGDAGWTAPAGYTCATWSGPVPDAHAEASAAAHNAMDDAPSGDMEEIIPTWNVERLRAVQQLVVDRGGELLTVAAVTPDGELAAYTELMLPHPGAHRALQYDTVVVPAHRGRGLGRAVKARMLAGVRGSHPALREIATTVADENGPMRAVNASLGYVRERGTTYYQLKL